MKAASADGKDAMNRVLRADSPIKTAPGRPAESLHNIVKAAPPKPLPALCCLLLVVLTLVACGSSSAPDLGGLTEPQAREAVAASGLILGRVSYDAKAEGRVWTVCAQSVAAGTSLEKDAPINITLAGAPPVKVPGVVTQSLKRARHRLEAAGLVLRQTTPRYHEAIDAGHVVKQTPQSGALLPAGSKVAVVVSKGPAPVSVPETVGLLEDEARSRLKDAGFRVMSTLVDSEAREGEVVGQEPGSGRLQPGRTVRISVSRGVVLVKVPDVYAILGTIPSSLSSPQLKASVAVAWINDHIADLGLSAAIDNSATDSTQGGREYLQYPRAGTMVPRGTVIRMEFTSGPGRVLDL